MEGIAGAPSRHDPGPRGRVPREEQDTGGDGFYVRFDGPARAIGCAQAAVEALRLLGIEIRAGVLTGEREVVDGKCAGLSASIGARVASLAGPSAVLVSQTVKDLVVGGSLTFEDAGEHELKASLTAGASTGSLSKPA